MTIVRTESTDWPLGGSTYFGSIVAVEPDKVGLIEDTLNVTVDENPEIDVTFTQYETRPP